MEKTLQTLYRFQTKALEKKIDFDIDLQYSREKKPFVDVKLMFNRDGSIAEARTLNTRFYAGSDSTQTKKRLDSIDYFIKTTI